MRVFYERNRLSLLLLFVLTISFVFLLCSPDFADEKSSPSGVHKNKIRIATSHTLPIYTEKGFEVRERQRVADLAAARFGCGSSMSNMKGLVDLGVGWIRTAIDIYPSFLRELRKAQEIDFSFLDKRVRNLQSNNILTFFIITPQKENGEWPSADDFAWVLGKIAERYDGDGVDDMPGLIYPLTNFEICNEINTELPEWSGFTDQIYLEYMRKCHRALHAANPGAKLFCGALEGPPTRGGNDTFDRLLSNGGGKYVDAISYHNYSELFMLDRTMTYLRNHNLLNKQIFITEGS